MSGDLAWRRLDQRLTLLQALQHLDVDGVGEAGLDEALFALASVGPDRHEARVIAVRHQPLGDVQNTVASGDDDLRIRRIAGAELGTRDLRQRDLDREHRRLFLLVRLEPDFRELAFHARAGQRADLQRHGHALLQPADVDFVDGSPEDQVPHCRHAHQHGPLLVRRQRYHGIADLDGVFQDVAVDRGPDDGLELLIAGLHLTALLEREALLRQRSLRARLVHLPLGSLEVGGGDHVSIMQFLLAGQFALHIFELDPAELRVASQLDHLERGGVGGDFQQRLARLDEVTHFGEPSPYYAGQG